MRLGEDSNFGHRIWLRVFNKEIEIKPLFTKYEFN